MKRNEKSMTATSVAPVSLSSSAQLPDPHLQQLIMDCIYMQNRSIPNNAPLMSVYSDAYMCIEQDLSFETYHFKD
jgi:hypothetical protein